MKQFYFFLLLAGAGIPAGAQWNLTTDMNETRSQHTAVAFGSAKVLAAGGWDGSVNLNTAEVYDYVSESWSPTLDMTSAHTTAAGVLLSDGKVLLVSGWDGSTNTTVCELYDPSTNSWSVTGALTTGRSYHTATLLNDGRVLVAGGYNGSVNTPACEVYNPATGTWSATDSLATGRSYHTATLLNDGRVLVTGGYNPAAGFQLSSAEIFDPVSNTWSNAAGMSDMRAWHSASILADGRVLVAGGEYFTGATPFAYEGLASAEIYNATTNTWTAASDMPGGLSYNQQFTLSGNKVLVVAGLASTDYGSGFTSAPGVTYLYNATTNTWSNVPMNIDARVQFGAAHLNSQRVLVTGGGDQTAEIFDSALSVEEILPAGSVSVYPNPSSGTVYAVTTGDLLLSVQITDLWGRQVYALQNIQASKMQLNLEQFIPGMYHLRAETAKGVLVQKFTLVK